MGGWRRGGILMMALGVLWVMAFYTLTEPAHLEHSQLLTGADWMGYAVCHRISERSFVINGRQFSLCARCTGMYLGVSVTFLVFWLWGRLRRTELPAWPLLLTLIGFMVVMGVDGLNSYSYFFPNAPHWYTPHNWLRLLTGVGTGLTMGCLIWPALAQTLWRHTDRRPMLTGWRDLLLLWLVAGEAILLVLSNQPTISYVLALVSTAGLVFLLGAINTIIGLTLLRREGRGVRWWETAVPLLIGIFLAILELSALSLLRFTLTGTMTGIPGL